MSRRREFRRLMCCQPRRSGGRAPAADLRVLWVTLLVIAWGLGVNRASAAEIPTPVEFQPEQVALALRFPSRPEWLPADRSRIRREIRQKLRALVGARWEVTLLKPGSQPALASGSLEALTPGDLAIDRARRGDERQRLIPSDTAPDKLFLTTIIPAGSDFQVATRAWDHISDSLGPRIRRTAATRDEIPRAVVATLVAAYRPVGQVLIDDDERRIVFRGAALTTPDRGLLAAAEGTLFRPVLRRRDREGLLVEIREVPYTYLELETLTGPSGALAVHSALRSPIGPFRGLITAWAIAAPPVAEGTRLILKRESDGVPLAGRRIEVRAEPPAPGEEPGQPLRTLLTDRSGTAVISPFPDHAVVWATIKSGDVPLMRIPVAPGAPPEITLSLGNDQMRLNAEGRLAILTGELIEIVAKRATLLATARGRARDGQFDEARDALEEAEALPTAEEFQQRLAAIATPAATAAEQAGQRMTAARIRVFGRQISNAIDSYLKPGPIADARAAIEALERAVKRQ